jgi:hypothetical protein
MTMPRIRLRSALAQSVLASTLVVGCQTFPPNLDDIAETLHIESGLAGREGILKEIVDAEYDYTILKKYNRLFDRLDMASIRQLEGHEDVGVALHAGWEEVRRSLSNSELNEPTQVNQEALQRFINLVNARAGVIAPNWWKDRVLAAQAYSRRSIHFDSQRISWFLREMRDPFGPRTDPPANVLIPGKGWQSEDGRLGVEVPRDSDLTQWRLVVGKEQILLPVEVRNECGRLGTSINVCASPSALFLAVHYTANCSPYQLFCLDRQALAVRWQTEVSGEGCGIMYSGPQIPDHEVQVVAEKDRVFVFGMDSGCVYVEAVRVADGKSVFRFSTRTWR